MALLDILRRRTEQKGALAQVDCGGLGLLTVEALSPAECARLGRSSRALLYAACRELQSAGEQLRQEGKVFRPDEILEYLTEEEARTAARAVLALSGMAERAEEDAAVQSGETAAETAAPLQEAGETALAQPPSPAALVEEAAETMLPSPAPVGQEMEAVLAAPVPKEDGTVRLKEPVPAGEGTALPLHSGGAGQERTVTLQAGALFGKTALALTAAGTTPEYFPNLQAAGPAAEVLPVLSEAGEAANPVPQLRSRNLSFSASRQEIQEALLEMKHELAEAAAETLARELRQAAMVR